MAVKMACFGTVLRRLATSLAAVVLGGAWVTLDAARVRLVDGGMTQGHRLAGVQIELDPGVEDLLAGAGRSPASRRCSTGRDRTT